MISTANISTYFECVVSPLASFFIIIMILLVTTTTTIIVIIIITKSLASQMLTEWADLPFMKCYCFTLAEEGNLR